MGLAVRAMGRPQEKLEKGRITGKGL